MKPAWDKLMDAFADSKTALVGDVDCTAAGKPICSPSNIDLCDDDKKAEIEKFASMSADDLDAAIKEKEKENETAESDFKTFVEGLQKQYEEAMKKKDEAIAAIKEKEKE